MYAAPVERSPVRSLLQGSAGFGLAPYEEAAELVRSGRVRLQPIVTHRFPLDRIAEAFETQMNTPLSGKVIVAPFM